MFTPWWSRTTPSPFKGDKADAAIYDGAIPGMLRVLDPHSNFYDPKAYAKMREDQRGHYYGVGMVIQQQNKKSTSSRPTKERPSFRAGLRPGDIISAIDGKSTEGMTSDLGRQESSRDPKAPMSRSQWSAKDQSKPLVLRPGPR